LVGDSLLVAPLTGSTASNVDVAAAAVYELSAITELRARDSADITVPNRLCSR